MTTDVARSIRRCRVPAHAVAVFWLGQAGFVFKTPEGRVVYADPYLSDSVERLFGFQRVMAGIVQPREVRADAVLVSHHHDDHLDVDALPVIAARTRVRFVAPPQAAATAKPDLVIPVINGAYGNMTAVDAAALTRDVGAHVAIPCHFWMFAEHGGDPAAFRAACASTAPATRVVLMTQGGCYLHGPAAPDVTSRA